MFGSLLPEEEKISNMKPQGNWASWFSDQTGTSPALSTSIANYQQPGIPAHMGAASPTTTETQKKDSKGKLMFDKNKKPVMESKTTWQGGGMIPETPYGQTIQAPVSSPNLPSSTTTTTPTSSTKPKAIRGFLGNFSLRRD